MDEKHLDYSKIFQKLFKYSFKSDLFYHFIIIIFYDLCLINVELYCYSLQINFETKVIEILIVFI